MTETISAAEYQAMQQGKPSKYGNKRTEVDGVVFDSMREAQRYVDLKRLLDAGEIVSLTLQPRFPIVLNGQKICVYRADFSYLEVATGKTVVEDTKGVRTPIYRLKAKLVRACLGIEIVEV